ncbi:MAG: DUF3836 domain-containing protein [Dysgonomonas sp.]|nr:DUF3836 domain-containing protein [Dysgonomonas sp.]
MKTRILTSILAVVFSLTLVYAGNPKTTMYINHEASEAGLYKEYIYVDSETLEPLKRIVYNYDTNGVIKEKILYGWEYKKGWTGEQKYTYQCNVENKTIDNLVYTEWDNIRDSWSDNSEYITYIYNDDSEFMSNTQIKAKTQNLAELK